MLRKLTLLALVTLTSIGQAQRRWVVDAKSGLGSDFTKLEDAIRAADHGDSLWLRPGMYTAGLTNKGLRIAGTSAVTIRNLHVEKIGAGRTFSLSGVKLDARGLLLGNTFFECAGSVVIENVSSTEGLFVSACASFVASDCTLPVAFVADSSISLTRVRLAGVDARKGSSPCFPVSAIAGLRVYDADAILADVTIDGGDGGDFCFFQKLPGAPGIQARDSRIVITGTKHSVIRAGTGPTGVVAAIEGEGGALLLDPKTRITGDERYTGFKAAFERLVPALSASESRRNTRVTVRAKPRSLSVTMLGLPGTPTALPLGQLWLDTSLLLTMDAAATDASGNRLFAFDLPTDPSLRGTVLSLQALTGTGRDLELSTPASIVLD